MSLATQRARTRTKKAAATAVLMMYCLWKSFHAQRCAQSPCVKKWYVPSPKTLQYISLNLRVPPLLWSLTHFSYCQQHVLVSLHILQALLITGSRPQAEPCRRSGGPPFGFKGA